MQARPVRVGTAAESMDSDNNIIPSIHSCDIHDDDNNICTRHRSLSTYYYHIALYNNNYYITSVCHVPNAFRTPAVESVSRYIDKYSNS